MPLRIKSRTDTAAQWAATNPKLARGEMGFEIDTLKFKFGDGLANWNALAYASGSGGGGVPPDVLRTTTEGVVLYQADNSIVGGAFVTAGFYQRQGGAWIFPYHLQKDTFERGPITTFPYTLLQADADRPMIFLQPTANASVVLPSGVASPPALSGMGVYKDIVFYLDNAVSVTFTAGSGVTIFVPGIFAGQASYTITGPRRTVAMQARSTNYRVLD